MKKFIYVCLFLIAGPAFGSTLTFDNDFTGQSYTEKDFTITAAPNTPGGVVIVGGVWDVPCCPSPNLDEFNAAIGGRQRFNLISIDPVHIDINIDPVDFVGFRGGVQVASQTINTQGGTVTFSSDFSNLDRVYVRSSGSFTDPTFDNLVFEFGEALPIPTLSTIGLLLAIFTMLTAGMFIMRRRV